MLRVSSFRLAVMGWLSDDVSVFNVDTWEKGSNGQSAGDFV
jgi:hypothetical protein